MSLNGIMVNQTKSLDEAQMEGVQVTMALTATIMIKIVGFSVFDL